MSSKIRMEQKETLVDHLFQEFISSFSQASPEEKIRLAGQFHSWAKQQADQLGLLPTLPSTGDVSENRKPTLLIEPGAVSSEDRQDALLQDVQSLVEGEIHLRQIAENTEQVFWLRDIESGRILYVSPAFETIWGRSVENLYADPSLLLESIHPEDRLQVMVATPLNNHKPFNQAYRILRPDGNLRWIYARTFLIRDNRGNNSSLFCMAQDITDTKQVELALRKTLDRTREQFELSRKMSLARKPEAVLKTLISAHELRTALRAALLFFEDPMIGPARGMELTAGWQSSQTLSPWVSETNLYEEPALWDLLQPNRMVVISDINNDPRLAPSVREFLQEGQIQTLAIFPLVSSGDWLGCLLVYYRQEQHFNYNELRHLKVLVDQATVTLYNLKLLKIEEESRHEAERANEIKTEFLAMISHELRTPLTSIIGFTTTMLAEDVTWEPDEQRDFIQTIQKEANRLEELIDQLLVLSRLEAGKMPIALASQSLQEILKDAMPQIQNLTSRHALSMHIPAYLPPISANAKRIAQVLVNLVRNASTYSPKGTEINISASVRGNFVQVNVSDQGPGIPLAEHKSVFKAFRRGEKVENGSTQGAGLGLAICKGLVEAHNGRIWIRKKTTQGATFSFTIPIASSGDSSANLATKE